MTRWLPGALLVAGLLAPSAAAGQAAQRDDYDSGAYLYRTFCASCHGAAARGDGPAADLVQPRPSDLTMLARGNGGVFPRARVTKVLSEGGGPGHRGPGMPNWQSVLRRAAHGNERTVRRQIEALVTHLETLQASGPF